MSAVSSAMSAPDREQAIRNSLAAALIVKMKASPGDERTQLAGCDLLHKLAQESGIYASSLDFPGAVEAVASSLALPGSVRLHVAACQALMALCYSEIHMLRAGAGSPSPISILLTAMRARAGSAEAQEWGCAALRNALCLEANKAQATAGGGIEIIVAAMSRFGGNVRLQEIACLALGCFSIDHDCGRARAATVVAAMRAHIGSAGVQKAGCNTLAGVALPDANKATVAAAGAVEAIASAMLAHAGSADVQVIACWALGNIACLAANQAKIAAAGGIELAAAALSAHAGNAEVQEAACVALRNISSANSSLQERVRSARGGVLAAAAMVAHPESALVQSRAEALLRSVIIGAGTITGPNPSDADARLNLMVRCAPYRPPF